MRQENGAELFGPDDPRSANVGMIHVSPSDDRQSIMTAILTQDKLGRRHTVLIMPDENAAFRRTTDFAYLRNLLQGLNTQLVIVASPNTPIARFAQRQQYPVFRSVENYASYARTFISEDQPPVTEEQEEPATPDSPQPAPAPSEQPEPVVVESDQMPTQPLDQRGQEAPWSTSLGEVEDDVPVPLRPLEARPLVVNEPASPGPLIAATDIALQEVPTGPTPQPRRRRTRLLLVSALLLALFLLIGGSVLSVFAGIGPLARLFPGSAASVTITAEKKLFKNVYAISAITWVPDPALHQVAAHFVSVNTPSQTKTVQSTGRGITPATTAQGTLTFFNALSFSQHIPAGTIFTDQKGVQVATDVAVTIPPANPPTEGSSSVPAHALVPGAQGNIPATDFKEATCCHAGITLTNRDAFSGGQDARPYAYVQQSDIDMAASSLAAQLTNDGKKAIQGKVQKGEQQAGETRCTANSGASHDAGEHSNSVTVTTLVTCVAEVFNRDDAMVMAANLLKSDAVQTFHTSYAQAGQVSTTLINAAVQNSQGTISLHIEAQGLWVAQFDAARQQQLARLITGLNIPSAQDLLAHQVGIAQASITVADSPGNVLPLDPRKITIRVA